MTTKTIPANGTKAAVSYWATRTRETMRQAQRAAAGGNLQLAAILATDAAGEAGEFETAMAALAELDI